MASASRQETSRSRSMVSSGIPACERVRALLIQYARFVEAERRICPVQGNSQSCVDSDFSHSTPQTSYSEPDCESYENIEV